MIDTDPYFRELRALDALGDEDIDTSDIPVRSDFSSGDRGKFFHLTARDYDVRAIANWCIARAKEKSQAISNLWLNKIVFFIYEEALQINNIIITGAKAEAWDHGPVFREIYFGTRSDTVDEFLLAFDPQLKKKVVAKSDFALADIAIFEGVWNRLGHFSGSRLRNLSHKIDSPWYRVWNYSGSSNPGMVIDIGTILGGSSLPARRNS